MKKRSFLIIALVIVFVLTAIFAYIKSNHHYSKMLVQAIDDGNIAEVERLINVKPECINTYPTLAPRWFRAWVLDRHELYPLNAACVSGNYDIVELLVMNGADVNCDDGMTPLAVTYRNKVGSWYRISEEQQQKGADINYSTEYSEKKPAILLDIVQKRSGAVLPNYAAESTEEVIQAFNYALERCDSDKTDWTWVLLECVSNSRLELAIKLLDNDYVDVNDTSRDISVLMVAARDSDLEMVKMLLDRGADPSYVAPDGRTALDYAVQFNDALVVDYLEQR